MRCSGSGFANIACNRPLGVDRVVANVRWHGNRSCGLPSQDAVFEFHDLCFVKFMKLRDDFSVGSFDVV